MHISLRGVYGTQPSYLSNFMVAWQETCMEKLFSLKYSFIYNTKQKAFFLRGNVEQNMTRESTETTFAIMFIQLSTLD